MSEQRSPQEPREREVIVTEGRSGAGTAIAVVVGVIVLVLLVVLLFSADLFGAGDDAEGPEVDVEVPDGADEGDTNVETEGGEGGDTQMDADELDPTEDGGDGDTSG